METMNLTTMSPSTEQQLVARSNGSRLILPTIVTTIMPTRGCALVPADAAADFGPESARTRKVAKGHVAFAAYVSGHPAWSPPLC